MPPWQPTRARSADSSTGWVSARPNPWPGCSSDCWPASRTRAEPERPAPELPSTLATAPGCGSVRRLAGPASGGRHLLTTPDGAVVPWCLADPELGDREVARAMLEQA